MSTTISYLLAYVFNTNVKNIPPTVKSCRWNNDDF